MRFKTPAPLFNVNGDHGARARRLFVYKFIQNQDPMIIDQSILSREVVVGCGSSYCQGVISCTTDHTIEKKVQIFFKDKLNCTK
jgi:hypothetical protein